MSLNIPGLLTRRLDTRLGHIWRQQVAGFGYLVDVFTFFLIPSFEVVVSKYTFVGELVLLLWLLIKGVNVEQWEQQALESTVA